MEGGSRWKKFLKEEQANWQSIHKAYDTKLIREELEAAKHVSKAMMFSSGDVQIGLLGTMTFSWCWPGESPQIVSDICVKGNYVWTIEDIGDGAELYAIRCHKKGAKVQWQQKGVAPNVAVIGNRCYALESKNTLVYYRLVSWNAYTGLDKQIHYEEKDYRYNLELLRRNESAILRRQSGGKQDIFDVSTMNLLEGISLDSRRFVIGSRASEYLMWTSSKWISSPDLIQTRIKLPSFESAVPEVLDTDRGLLITKWFGERILWKISSGNPKVIWKGNGNLEIDKWDGPWIRQTFPGAETAWFKISDSQIKIPKIYTNLYITTKKFVESADGTKIPYILISPVKPIATLIVGYGAYGLPTSLSTSRWAPLLKRGWAISIGLWRGGGDHTPEWEDAGRCHGRTKVLEDAEAVVREVKKITKVPVILYGRSAGGLWVGGLCAKFPNGELAKGAYMEVPYLDVLQTTTNRNLPLTNIETDEFGLPAQRLSDMASILKWSPMENLENGTPGIWQLVRTGTNDSEVFAYESAKWIVRSRRGGGKNIVLAIEEGQGHFVTGSLELEQAAQDICFLLNKI